MVGKQLWIIGNDKEKPENELQTKGIEQNCKYKKDEWKVETIL